MPLLSTFGAGSGRGFGFQLSAISLAIDELFNSVTLLLPGDGTNGAQNNTFLDSSSNNFTITRNGNATQGTFSPFSQTGWSNYFDGTDDYLAVADNVVLRPGTSNFTLEAWIWRGASGAAHTIYAKGGASTGIVFQVTSTNVLRFTHTTTNIDSTGTISANSWTHVAVVREGTGTNQTKLYINGTQDGQGTVSTDFTQTEEVRIGTNRGATEDFNGYISNLRFVKGTALYTGTFTPSTTPLTTTSQGATATEVELLTCKDNRFLDNSSNAFTITVNGTPSVQAFSPFAPTAAYSAATVGGSGYFDGSGDYLTSNGILVTTTTANTLSCEGWFYPTSFANLIWLIGDMQATAGTNNISVDISTGGAVELYWYDGAVKRCTSTSLMRLNQWNWFAIVVNAGAISIYVNSTTAGQSGTTTLTNRSAASQNFAIGQHNNSTTPNGYISNLRWSTSARTISSIPTAPYTSDANTRLLLNFTNAGITDATAKNDLETVGNAQISTTQSKFGGSSMYFDGTGDWLLMPHTIDQIFGTGALTVEFWLYLGATGTARGLVAKGTSTTGWLVSLDSSNKVVFTYGASTITSTGTISATTWTHIAVVREGTGTNQTKIYINGTNDGTGTVNTDFNQTSVMYVGANRTGGDALNGYIDDLRITRGYARYTANFTPPTASFPVQ